MDKRRVSEYGTDEVREVITVGLTTEEQEALESAHQISFAAMYSTDLARTNAVKVAVGVELPAATE
jgi:hypothetical protein